MRCNQAAPINENQRMLDDRHLFMLVNFHLEVQRLAASLPMHPYTRMIFENT